MNKIKKFFSGRMLLIIDIALFVFCCLFNSAFLSSMNISGLLVETSYMLLLAIGMTFVILTGGIDLSVAAVAGLSTVFVAYVMKHMNTGVNALTVLLAVVLALAVSAAFGLLNGIMVGLMHLPPIIVTLSVTWIATGLANRLIKGAPLALKIKSFKKVILFSIGGYLPVVFLIALIVFILFILILDRTKMGRQTYATGSSYYSAYISGINVRRVLIRAYVLSGLFAGIAGLIISANLNSGYATAATDYELYTIAAVVMGGIALTGGEGKLLNVLFGVLFLRILRKIVVFTGISNISGFIEGIIIGAILIAVLIISSVRKKV